MRLCTTWGCSNHSVVTTFMFVPEFMTPKVRNEGSGQLWGNDQASWSIVFTSDSNSTCASRAKGKISPLDHLVYEKLMYITKATIFNASTKYPDNWISKLDFRYPVKSGENTNLAYRWTFQVLVIRLLVTISHFITFKISSQIYAFSFSLFFISTQ